MSLRKLAKIMDDFETEIENKVNDIVKDIAEEVLLSLLSRTPVDTSKAVSNWVIGLGEKDLSVIKAHFFGRRGSTRDQSMAAAYGKAMRELKMREVGVGVHISNSVDYIKKLDNREDLIEVAEKVGLYILRSKGVVL